VLLDLIDEKQQACLIVLKRADSFKSFSRWDFEVGALAHSEKAHIDNVH